MDLKSFFKHAQKLSASFAIVDSGMQNADSDPDTNDEPKSGYDKNRRSKGDANSEKSVKLIKSGKQSLCFWPPQKRWGIRHSPQACKGTSGTHKVVLLNKHANIWQKILFPVLHLASQWQRQETQCVMAPRKLADFRPLALIVTNPPAQSCCQMPPPE